MSGGASGGGGELLGEEAVQPRAEGFVVEVQEPVAATGRGNERMGIKTVPLERCSVSHRVGKRPNRVEPRAIKGRPKNHKLTDQTTRRSSGRIGSSSRLDGLSLRLGGTSSCIKDSNSHVSFLALHVAARTAKRGQCALTATHHRPDRRCLSSSQIRKCHSGLPLWRARRKPGK